MSKTLLLADDSVTIQKVVGISFANEDVVLVTVDNGDDAIAKARETRPDIVLADVVMPGKNGYEVCEAIKALPDLAHVPVLLLTGTFEAFDEARANAVGADGHITKPFEAQALVDTVNARLAEAAAAPAAVTSDEAFGFLEEPGSEPSLTATETPPITLIMGEDRGDSSSAFSFDPASGSNEPALVGSAAEDPVNAQTQLVIGSDEMAYDETLPPSGERAPLAPAPSEDPAVGLFEGDDPNDATRIMMGDAEPDAPALEIDPDFDVPLDLGSRDEARSAALEPGIDPLADAGVEYEGVLDPDGARDYDVSSSDLDDSSKAVAAAPTAEPETAGEEPDGFAAVSSQESSENPLQAPDPESFNEPVFSAPLDPEPETVAVADDPPLEPMETVDAEPGAASPVEPVELVELVEPVEQVGLGDGGAAELSPLMREQLHDVLEKVAWEAFGDVAERIVHDALARVEEVAWEVIPKLAEVLIQEEIRKMKGDE